ncbi:MAG TPA: hypothetical protein VHS56_01150 [Candidatus Cybelea sp.]|jgi:hypothetical protein|nr:hypothetical protein [Candidatus Cybelea sp.]
MNLAVAIALKIPDNTAYTAAVALRRLGLGVGRVERSEIWLFDDGGDSHALLRRIEADERIFNPNKHVATILARPAPRTGEVWIESLDSDAHPHSRRPAAVAWRLLDAHGAPFDPGGLRAAVERLLCNPAIERAVY